MGGRGASIGKRFGSYATSGQITIGNNETCYFDGELKYGNNDVYMSETVRTIAKYWENKRLKNKIEYALVLDSNGNEVGYGEIKGSKNKTSIPNNYLDVDNSTLTHIHPREDGMFGGSFSYGDMVGLTKHENLKTIRAVAKEGTYSMTKNKNFNSTEAIKYFKSINQRNDSIFIPKLKQLTNDYRSGKMQWNEYDKEWKKINNNALIDLHNGYLAGQKQYGYKYTLEKRS